MMVQPVTKMKKKMMMVQLVGCGDERGLDDEHDEEGARIDHIDLAEERFVILVHKLAKYLQRLFFFMAEAIQRRKKRRPRRCHDEKKRRLRKCDDEKKKATEEVPHRPRRRRAQGGSMC